MWRLILVAILFALPALGDELRKDGSAYYIDKDDDDARETLDQTEPFVDFLRIEVPGDYTTVQSALDSIDCKKGTTTANLGCHIVVAPGTYTEKFEISDPSDPAQAQYSVVIEGAGAAGYGAGATNLCATTFIGDASTVDHTVIDVEDSIGVTLRNFCIDMGEAATKPKYGIALGSSTASATINKHITIENISIFNEGASGGAGIRIGNGGGVNSDTAFNTIRNVYMEGVRTCVDVNAAQAVGNIIDVMACSGPTATIGGVSIGSAGGQINIRELYFRPGAANQIGINVHNNAVGALFIQNPTFEWSQDNGTFINFEDPGNQAGAYRTTTIIGGRFQPQYIATTRHVCIDFNRQGNLFVVGNSFESSNASRLCEFDFHNPSPSKAQDITWIANDMQWDGTQSDPRVTRSTANGAIRIAVLDDGDMYNCSGAAAVGSLTKDATGCYGLGVSGASTAALAAANDNSTLIATTSFVQQEINGAGGNDLTCASGSCDVDTTVALDTELAAKSSASSTDNAIARFDSTAGDIQSSSVLIDDSNNLTVPGSITTGTSGASCMMYRDTDDAGYTECFWLNGVQSCTIDADGVCDGA